MNTKIQFLSTLRHSTFNLSEQHLAWCIIKITNIQLPSTFRQSAYRLSTLRVFWRVWPRWRASWGSWPRSCRTLGSWSKLQNIRHEKRWNTWSTELCSPEKNPMTLHFLQSSEVWMDKSVRDNRCRKRSIRIPTIQSSWRYQIRYKIDLFLIYFWLNRAFSI